MGKTSSVNVATPAFAGGSISVNGKNKAAISKQGNMVNSNYNMDEFEQSMIMRKRIWHRIYLI